MTSFVRFFAFKAIAAGAALSMTAGLAIAGETISTSTIVNSLKGTPATRGLSTGPDKAKDTSFLNSVRNRSTRSLSTDERNQIETITANKPNIDLEINFDFNSAAISRNSVTAVQHLGEALSDPQLKGSTFVVAGHTDGVGSEPFNQDLSERRADTIKQFLVEKYHVAASDLVTVGYGKTRLKDTANPADAANRRVQVVNTQTDANASNNASK
jgi:outer membrane protein OmpA-like peptidoglycan-associated protein